ncbi:MAG: hypothetical protein ACFFBZ_15265 [Promethearchaeota archaeon]
MEAAKKPKKWRAVGLRNMLIISAIRPTNVAVPSFLVHQIASIKAENPITSQRKGKLNISKKIGVTVTFSTPHRAAKIVIPARSRVLK